MKKRTLFLLWIGIGIAAVPAHAEIIYLVNGDRVTGEVIHKNAKDLIVKTVGMGTIAIQKNFIEERLPDKKAKALEALKEEPKKMAPKEGKPKLWGGKIRGTVDRTRGNTKSTALSGGFEIHRKVEKKNEFHLKGNAYYSSQDRKMNSQRYDAMIRYAHSFGQSKKWYNFYKTEGDHDRFANINVRITPSTGVGYWFSDKKEWKFMTELGLGVTFTDFGNDTDEEAELVLIPRAYAEKKLIGESKISQEAIFYPSLSDRGEYRLHLDTALTNPITDQLSLRVSWINDYNSDPGKDVKEHDMRLTTGLEYSF